MKEMIVAGDFRSGFQKCTIQSNLDGFYKRFNKSFFGILRISLVVMVAIIEMDTLESVALEMVTDKDK